MIEILAQTTQATTQPEPQHFFYFWSNVSSTTIIAGILTTFIVANLVLDKVKEFGGKLIAVWFGWKSAARKEQEKLRESVAANAQALMPLIEANEQDPTTPGVPPEVKASVRTTAAGDK